ncbi:type II toxin-antitoxin system ParD family antitoxin [Aquibium carbonis]|uniref:Type II toxin-antitoxin system ParD family antitoxin n=1 Tax=Aquibium carbonis TaxID=2495581 RepID=A0A3S0ABQ7_9HYPH|nr:type II toxin-antitoxin system ParD family antitoxin [Aquibium carbonis]RST88111.1 type II toxin-antitoxin system ParD family antitoxin [Aquibium carbonis]
MVTISLSTEQAERLRNAVASGAYASSDDVVQDALRLWELRERERAEDLARLKQAYVEGKHSGTPREIDRESFLADLREQFRARG